ncbi:helix-turn-helix domain-containing protein [Leuconostoc miyukkimchii]|uniref:helix-turn-helix domain-containing protein n=1 Tax=Leuconostoc miyukkimchii TaxID=910540 RepID=UPI001FEC2228|nr:helix-turn-helix transcriptional regulator [Leuconostoc miyukkimchii]
MIEKKQDTFSEVQNFGRFIRKIREDRHISATDLVNATGVSRSVISKFERGQTDIQFSSMIKILSALSLTLDDLCYSEVFSGFEVNELIEKAYAYQNDINSLISILEKLNQRDILLHQEQVFKIVLEVRINNYDIVPNEVTEYFDNLSVLWQFDAYLAILAAPFLPERIGLRILRQTSRYMAGRPAIIDEVALIFANKK